MLVSILCLVLVLWEVIDPLYMVIRYLKNEVSAKSEFVSRCVSFVDLTASTVNSTIMIN